MAPFVLASLRREPKIDFTFIKRILLPINKNVLAFKEGSNLELVPEQCQGLDANGDAED